MGTIPLKWAQRRLKKCLYCNGVCNKRNARISPTQSIKSIPSKIADWCNWLMTTDHPFTGIKLFVGGMATSKTGMFFRGKASHKKVSRCPAVRHLFWSRISRRCSHEKCQTSLLFVHVGLLPTFAKKVLAVCSNRAPGSCFGALTRPSNWCSVALHLSADY